MRRATFLVSAAALGFSFTSGPALAAAWTATTPRECAAVAAPGCGGARLAAAGFATPTATATPRTRQAESVLNEPRIMRTAQARPNPQAGAGSRDPKAQAPGGRAAAQTSSGAQASAATAVRTPNAASSASAMAGQSRLAAVPRPDDAATQGRAPIDGRSTAAAAAEAVKEPKSSRAGIPAAAPALPLSADAALQQRVRTDKRAGAAAWDGGKAKIATGATAAAAQAKTATAPRIEEMHRVPSGKRSRR